MRHADFRTYHRQVEHLNEMRNIQASHFHMRLMLPPGHRLPVKTFRIKDVSRLKTGQEIPGRTQYFEAERNSVRIVIRIRFLDGFLQRPNARLVRIWQSSIWHSFFNLLMSNPTYLPQTLRLTKVSNNFSNSNLRVASTPTFRRFSSASRV